MNAEFPSKTSFRTTASAFKVAAVVFGSLPLAFAALFFIGGGPDPGAGSGPHLLFRSVGLPFLGAAVILALPNKLLVTRPNAIVTISIISAILFMFSAILIAVNGIEYISTSIPFLIFCAGAISSVISLHYYKKIHPSPIMKSKNENEKWVL